MRQTDMLGVVGASMLLSEAFMKVLEDAKCTGMRTARAVVCDRQGQRILDSSYALVQAEVGAGPINKSRGSERLVSADFDAAWLAGDDLEDAYGLYFDPKSWTGAEIFVNEGSWTCLVTSRLAKRLEKARLTGFQLDPVPEYGGKTRDETIARLKVAYPWVRRGSPTFSVKAFVSVTESALRNFSEAVDADRRRGMTPEVVRSLLTRGLPVPHGTLVLYWALTPQVPEAMAYAMKLLKRAGSDSLRTVLILDLLVAMNARVTRKEFGVIERMTEEYMSVAGSLIEVLRKRAED